MPRQQRLEVVAKADRVLHKAPEQYRALVGYVHPQKLLVVLLDAAPKGVEGVVVCQNGATILPRGASGLECAIHCAHNGALGLLHWRLNPLDLRRLFGRGRRRSGRLFGRRAAEEGRDRALGGGLEGGCLPRSTVHDRLQLAQEGVAPRESLLERRGRRRGRRRAVLGARGGSQRHGRR